MKAITAALLQRFAFAFFFTTSIAALSACTTFTARPEAPRVTLAGLSFVGVGRNDAHVRLRLDVRNPNGFDLRVNSLEFDLSVNDTALLRGGTARPETLPARGRASMEIDTHTDINALARVLSAINREGPVRYKLSGIAVIQDDRRLPFMRQGEMPVPHFGL